MAQSTLLLLVEDDILIQDVVDLMLTDAGFKVIAVNDGTQALAEIDTDARRFAAVVTDIRLGSGPDGWHVARQARERVQDMPVVYISGDSAYKWSSQGVPKSVMVAKPFTEGQLITAVCTLLNARDTNE